MRVLSMAWKREPMHTINFRVDFDLLARIENARRASGLSRQEWIKEVIVEHLDLIEE